ILANLAQLPGVSHTAVTQRLPLRGRGWSASLRTPGAPADAPSPYFRFVSADYFATLGIPLRRGRTFDSSDLVTDSIRPVVINEALARIFFPNVDPIGQLIPSNFLAGRDRIIGIVGDVAEDDL